MHSGSATTRGAPFATVTAKGISKVYGRERALAQVDVTLAAGDSVALLGPNGAGKSTLISILATLVRPTTGAVLFDGARASRAHRGGIGVLAHESLCYGDLTARENLDFFAAIHQIEDASTVVRSLLERVGLTHAADRPARTFSRGMLQRLAVGRAILPSPRLLLLDEPFTGLDRQGHDMLTELLSEQRSAGAILLIVTHDLEPLPVLTNRAILLRRGRVAHDGAAPTTFADYRALYRSLLEGTAATHGGGGPHHGHGAPGASLVSSSNDGSAA